MRGNLYIISAPSGCGKSSLISALLEQVGNSAMLSVSHTTRAMRAGEIEGVHYYFVDTPEFERLIEENIFLEYARVFGGDYYGTSRLAIEKNLAQGKDVFLDIDWQGARQIRDQMPRVKTIFILPPSIEELERRLRNRGKDSDEIIAKRMAKAIDEISHYDEYDYVIINQNFATALQDLQAILRSERLHCEFQQQENVELIKQLLGK